MQPAENPPDPALAAVAAEYFDALLSAQPISATMLGLPGLDGEVADPSRAGAAAHVRRLAGLQVRLAGVDAARLNRVDRTTRSVLEVRLRIERASLTAGLSEVAVSASVAGELSQMLSMVPRVSLADHERAASYLRRLAGLGGYFDALRDRYRQAGADGRHPTATGVRQAIAQLDEYLAGDLRADPLLRPLAAAPPGVADRWRPSAERVVVDVLHPALRRLRDTLAGEILAAARGDDRIGLCFVPGGGTGYADEIRYFTTTALSADEIHLMGLALVAELREDLARLGAATLGSSDVVEVLRALPSAPSMRFRSAEQILDSVVGAYRRAEQAVPDWFHRYALPECAFREMDPIQARGGITMYYRYPPTDGSEPGALWINTYRAAERSAATYEVLAFHEGLPGHHLQIAVSAAAELPSFRRYRRISAHSEGWGLYAEKLADEMGLYSSPTARLGMLASASWRACRLVVDTGIHHLGWSREQAAAFMRTNTALSAAEISNEIDRYIAAPGQALSYSIGRVRIDELRKRAARQIGGGFDIAEFHHRVLADGSVPLDTLDLLIDEWIAECRSGGAAR